MIKKGSLKLKNLYLKNRISSINLPNNKINQKRKRTFRKNTVTKNLRKDKFLIKFRYKILKKVDV